MQDPASLARPDQWRHDVAVDGDVIGSQQGRILDRVGTTPIAAHLAVDLWDSLHRQIVWAEAGRKVPNFYSPACSTRTSQSDASGIKEQYQTVGCISSAALKSAFRNTCSDEVETYTTTTNECEVQSSLQYPAPETSQNRDQ